MYGESHRQGSEIPRETAGDEGTERPRVDLIKGSTMEDQQANGARSGSLHTLSASGRTRGRDQTAAPPHARPEKSRTGVYAQMSRCPRPGATVSPEADSGRGAHRCSGAPVVHPPPPE